MSHLYRHPPRTGKYWIAYRHTGKLYRKSLNTKDRTTAKYLQSKHDKDHAEGREIPIDTNPTCLYLLAEYTAATQHHKAAKTLKNDEHRIRDFISWTGIQNINQVTEQRVQDYLNHRINTGLALRSANRYTATLKAWLNYAVRRKALFENPLRYFKGYRAPQNPPKYLNPDEVERLLKAAHGSRLYPAIMAALYTGMRLKEIYSLDWPDIDFTRDIITVQNKTDFTTKSKRFRTIPLHPRLKAVLSPLRKPQGRCFDRTNHVHSFPRIVRAAGLQKIGFHHFRHTFASTLALSGVDLYTIAQLLGHSSISVTMQYAHLTKGHMAAALDKLIF